jgi:hypothetical protein
MTFSTFREMCRCSLGDSLRIVREHSKMKHGVDVNFVFSSSSSLPLLEIGTTCGRICKVSSKVSLHSASLSTSRKEFALSSLVSVDKLFSRIDLSGPGATLIKCLTVIQGHNIVKNVILANQKRADYKDRTRFKQLFFTVISKCQDPKLDVQDGRKLVGAAICSASMCYGRRIMPAPDSTMLSLDDMRKFGYCLQSCIHKLPGFSSPRLRLYHDPINVCGSYYGKEWSWRYIHQNLIHTISLMSFLQI